MAKTFEERLIDLKSHTTLLSEACDRFSDGYKPDEIRNIGLRLRVLVGRGKGNGLLFALMDETGDQFRIMALNQIGKLKIIEVENGTNRILHEIERMALITQIPGRLPIVFPLNQEQALYKEMEIRDWIENGFLLDWDTAKEGSSKFMRFTPQALINRYAGQEAAHSDLDHGVFGGPVESVTMRYTYKDDSVVVPVVYEYLYQIGTTVSEIARRYIEIHS